MKLPQFLLRDSLLRGVLITTAVSTIALAPLWRAFVAHPDSIHTTILGDQGFYAWAILRGRAAPSFSSFALDCGMSVTRCFDLLSVPQEWPSFYVHGKVASVLHARTNGLMSFVYYSSPFLNSLAALGFVGVVARNWTLAGAIGPLVGFQLSLLFRLRGHLSLVYLWPLLLALTCWWLVLTSMTRVKPPRPAKLFGYAAGFCAAWTALSLLSYYYFFFSLPLLAVLTVSFFLCGLYESGFTKALNAKRIAVAASAPVAAAIAALTLNAHAMLGGSKTGSSHVLHRSAADVMKFSPRLRDFVLPYDLPGPRAGDGPFEEAAALPLFRALGATQSERELMGRGEVFAFLGATALALSLATFVCFAWRMVRHRDAMDVRRISALCLLLATALFMGTAEGGLRLHAIVPAIRCFDRMAPLVVLFLGAESAIVWAHFPRVVPWLTLAVAISAAIEFEGYVVGGRILDPANVSDISDFRARSAVLSHACAGGALRVAPPIRDYSLGPYWKLLAGEIARCRLDGVSGPGGTASRSNQAVVGLLENDLSVKSVP